MLLIFSLIQCIILMYIKLLIINYAHWYFIYEQIYNKYIFSRGSGVIYYL